MADGSILIDTHIDNAQAQKELGKLRKSLVKLQSDLGKKTTEQSAVADQLNKASAAAEETRQKIKSLEAELKSLKGLDLGNVSSAEYFAAQTRIPQIEAEIKSQNTTLQQQTREADKLASSYQKISGEVNQIKTEIKEAATAAGELQKKVTGTGTHTARASKEMVKFKKRIVELVKSALLFSVLTRGLTSLREWLGKTVKANDEAAAAVGRLKGALQTLAAPILNSAMPALTNFINFLARVVATIGYLISLIGGTSFAISKNTAEGLNAEQEALEGVGGAASDAAKQLAAFDEINKIAEPKGGGGGGIDSDIKTLFDVEPFEGKVMDFVTDLALKINEFIVDWEEGDLATNQDAWNTALSGLLGAILGGTFGGLKGAVLGLLLGLGLGLTGATFTDDMEKKSQAKKNFTTVLGAILGAIIGGKFGGLAGSMIGLLLSLSISLTGADFLEKLKNESSDATIFHTVLDSLLGAVIGAALGTGIFTGVKGAVLGLSLTLAISLLSTEFFDELQDSAAAETMFHSVLTTMLTTILGAKFGGLAGPAGSAAGAVVGLLLGIAVSWIGMEFSDGLSEAEKEDMADGFRVVFMTILGAVIGFAIPGAGLAGAIGGGLIGMTLGFSISISDWVTNDGMESKDTAANTFKTVVWAIVGALIGASIGGVFGGIAGGMIGLSLGIAIDITSVKVQNAVKNIGDAVSAGVWGALPSSYSVSTSSYSLDNVPALASGAVIPPNREFMAVLGDQKSGTNIETPLATMVQAFRQALNESGRSGQRTIILEVDKRELGRVTFDVYNAEAQRVGVSLGGG